ncbi:MAG: DPP IV N-terminal domain-containing protein [Acidobacteria bacterium]|nr:DPP IV N-terminal domain-containing protein [Acidobacteriota bacterium]
MFLSVAHQRSSLSRLLVVCGLAFAFAVMPAATPRAQKAPPTPKPNYDLASQWTTQKVGRLVFDSSVTPRWLESGDRFWYSYQTRDGRKFLIVDAVKKIRAPLFDHAKMAATLTAITLQPYDAQHLPFTTIRFVKKDSAFQFDVTVPRDAQIVKPKKPAPPEPPAADKKGAAAVKKDGAVVKKYVPVETSDAGTDDDDDQQQRTQQQQQQRGQTGQAGQRPGAATPPPRPRTLHFEYDLATGALDLLDDDYRAPRRPRWVQMSPDEKTIIFARNHNLFMMDAASFALAEKKADDPKIVEVQLTKDGEENYSYARTAPVGGQIEQQQEEDQQTEGDQAATDKNARVAAVMVTWSRDSKKFALVRRDQRKVADLWVIDSLASPRPKLETYRYAMPGEANVPQSELNVFDRDTKAMVKTKIEKFKDQTVSIANMPTRGGGGRGGQGGGAAAGPDAPPPPQWLSETADKLYFTRTSRDLKRVDICVANPETGDVKVLIEERLNTYIDTKPLRLINKGIELVHWSERTGWGHYYLYDAATGALKNAITSGEFVTTSVDGIDEKLRVAFFSALGREAGEDPYYPHLYRVNLDGTGLKLLNPGDASHAANMADSNRYFVDNASRINMAPTSSLYDAMGTLVTPLETTDVSALVDAGFKYPEPFKVKADDGITDLFGVMYKPFDFDPAKKYPVILYVYPGPQQESVTKTFNPRSGSMSLAQFGFIVVEVGNRGGSPQRSKWYHNYGYGNLRDYGLADKKAAVEQLARKNTFIDINKVGIWGHSGGGFMSTAAMLVYPDFFKVAVSESGNHENNIYNNTWSEKHQGVKEVVDKDGNITFEYNIEKNSELAKNLKGHLMLSTGDIDNNVHPANTYRLIDALIKANKRFDFVVLPGQRHGYATAGAYFNMVRADYFCRWLLGEASESVDIVELNREREQVGDKRVVRQ